VSARRPAHRLAPGLLWAVLAGLALVGIGAAAPLQVLAGAGEQGGGASVGATTPAYWTWEATQLWGMPSPTPALASGTVGTPTILPAASTDWRTGSATAGNLSVRWEFQEGTGAPRGSEIELRFTVGLSRAVSSFRIYLETQLVIPVAAVDYYLYWDAGGFAPGVITVESIHVTVLACTSIGVCP
jgi:hypothetical protein